jgi:prolyl-tRNA synthetase
MKYSKLFGKTKKESKEYDSKNATFLIKGGFIDQTMAGVYKFLPLGLRVLTKIENIVREEMDRIGQEMLLTALAPREFWETTNRVGIDVLMETRGANKDSLAQNDSSYILNPTHEDNITPLVKQFTQSYKDFPIALYQIQNKFRNEARPKSGLLRGREFRMKDLYSFHVSKEDFEKYYELAKEVYRETFRKLGIEEQTVMALASGGDFTKNYSHEFQTKCEAGEDLIFHDTVNNIYYNREVAASKAPDYPYDSEMKTREDVYGENIVSVEKLVEFLKVPVEVTIKTMLYESGDKVIAAGVRGDYEVDENKLKKVLGVDDLTLASEETVKNVTGAELGYAGILDLPESVIIICDEALEKMVNFEVGANKTHYHTINANWDKDIKKPAQFHDIKVAKEGDLNPETKQAYEVFKAAEVGNIFPLETKFPDAFDFKYTDEYGELKQVYMGSYGIGTSRLVGVIAEIMNDEKGLIWPEQIAPYKVHLISIASGEEAESYQFAQAIYDELNAMKVEVLWDDRIETRPGEKFADADLIGIPIRVIASKKTLDFGKENGWESWERGVEFKKRNSNESEMIKVEELFERMRK